MLKSLSFTMRNEHPSEFELRDDRPEASIRTQIPRLSLEVQIEFMRKLNELIRSELALSLMPGTCLVYHEIKVGIFPTIRSDGFILSVMVPGNDYIETTFLTDVKLIAFMLMIENLLGQQLWKGPTNV